MFTGRTDVEAETPVLWPPHVKSCLIGKDSDAGRDWGQEEKGTTEDEMAGWHHQLNQLRNITDSSSFLKPVNHRIIEILKCLRES